ncbi:hypothetical protein LNN31_02400 [Acetobacterium wieringae]|uniref:Uncharacterized protein n=1 Tax=Acetobacterium wieringae TaxID=52694 RepID=A0ABY6HI98_9FIRM|nr:hypothetical protein [Acetobacterium wieringae]UYO63316.1 hypothetical protein LNN31_02400 [Acetobacterium wieringae]VUZ24076.1 Uncharacterised protein [Acetobacterium wieringae]
MKEKLNINEMIKSADETFGVVKTKTCFTKEESGENPKQMRYRDCRKASVGNSFFIDRDDPTQSGSDHNRSTAILELLS